MILFHPLNQNKETNQIAIEKYKDRPVKIKHGLKDLWFGLNGLVSNQNEAEVLSFKNALKRTKNYNSESKIAYIFLDQHGTEKPNIKDFDPEDIYNCPTVTFDHLQRN